MSLESFFTSIGLKEACTPEVAAQPTYSLNREVVNFPSINQFHEACPSIPKINHIRKSIDLKFDSFISEWGEFMETLMSPLLKILVWSEDIFISTPWWLMVIMIAAGSYALSRSYKLVTGIILGMILIGFLNMWNGTMQTISFIFICTLMCVALGIPIGILMSYSKKMKSFMSPILDILQTMPIFVYLIPVVMLFGVGKVPGAIAVLFYAIPPVIRLTELGIRQVDKSVLEAADAFGVSDWQKLLQIQMPLAMPSIMLGINQTIMMSLAMVVIASMVGVRGLGMEVLGAVSNQYLAQGLFSGLAVVLVAIAIDRVTSSSIKGKTE